ncbi:TIGR03545 family protein [Thalassotalea euphylliae]|uniref:TIGR03545 family protein n=1 Tax=Thalassotalea euphylliae TaxID=1655234 RepID=A0A3E0TME1_9GAMM|nr:TIGR03545 family protein [Thalassotalea euphylliae]REL25729.1 TIGR03545 family protein [Thalassotalea euphylliae]
MSKVIRWQGLLAFVVIIALLFGAVILFAGPIAKMAIERFGRHYTGAEVNVAEVDVNFAPFGVKIWQLQATDPKAPQNNMLAFDAADASVELWPFLFGKTIVDNVEIKALSFNTARQSVGAVYRAPEESAVGNMAAQWQDDIQANLPDPKAVLEQSNLLTVQRAKALEETYQREQDLIERTKAKLPTKETLKEYQARVKALGQVKVKSLADIEKIKADFDQLKADFKQEREKIKQAKAEVIAAKNTLSEQVVALKNAPSEDWQNISQQYQLQTLEAEDFAHLLFGEKAREYYQWADIVFTHIKPLLAGEGEQTAQEQTALAMAQGRFVHFEEDAPLPDFWLKQGRIEVVAGDARYQAQLSDITMQHWLIDKASDVKIAADGIQGQGALNAALDFTLDASQQLTSQGNWQLAKLPLENIGLQETDNLTLQLVSALLSVAGNMSVNKGNLALTSDFNLAGSQFDGSADSKIAKVVLDTLKANQALGVTVNANGDWLSPNWGVSSDLDNLLGNALAQQVEAKLAGFKSELQAGLNDKMAGSLSLGEGQLGELLDFEALLNDSDKAFENLANNDVVKQQRKKLEDKAKDKIKDKLGKLFGG